MGYILCTAEKPSVAKDIARVIGANRRMDGYFEGNGYIVTWAVGHLVGLAEPPAYGFVPQAQIYSEKKGEAYAELPLVPKAFKLAVLEPTKAQFKVVKALMGREDVDSIIDCGDMGPEGHILQWFIREMASCGKPVMRFCATSMTDEAIQAAMRNLRPISDFEGVIRGEFCKKKADWILGMSMSRVASLKYNAGINVGRVQSPTLYFVVKRYLEVSNFKVTDYYTMSATLAEGFKVFYLKDTDGRFDPSLKDSEGRVLSREAVDKVAEAIQQGHTGVVSGLAKQKKAMDRPQLYDITELQRDANKIYGYTASATLAAAQSLYETHKVLSYPRTDSRFITSDLERHMPGRVRAIGGFPKYDAVAKALLSSGLNIDGKIVNDAKVTDHHAIVPTENLAGFDLSKLLPTIEEKKKGVTPDMLKNVLDLVLCRMLVSFSQPYIYEQTNVSVTFKNGFVFSSSGSKPISCGWKGVLGALRSKGANGGGDPDEGLSDNQVFPNIAKGQTVNVLRCITVPKKTAPPKLHTEATLLTAMENADASIDNGAILKGKGIGTQATRADIIKKLFDTGVVETVTKGKTNYIQPTPKGLGVIRILPKELYSPVITADWETKIAMIANGKCTEDNFMRDFVAFIGEKVREVKEGDTGVSFRKEREVFGKCKWCGADIYRYVKRSDSGKTECVSYYCSDSCGFRLDTSNQTFEIYLGRHLTDAEAKKFIANGFIAMDIKNRNNGGTYKGQFVFKERISNDKKFCNVYLERVSSR